ncbi:TATA box-binding protein-associated factor RNA polymerase I subunit B isoform X1 [Tanacetum coccineum]
MTDVLRLTCKACNDITEFKCDDDDGFYYCQPCGAQGIMCTAVQDDDKPITQEKARGMEKRRVVPADKTEQHSQSQPLSQFWQILQTQADNAEAAGNHGPTDFPVTLCHEDYYSEIRMRYVMGVQIMLQLQIKALVDKFNVSLVILDLVEPIWSKFVASIEVFADDRANEVINESKTKVVNGRTDHISGKTKGVGRPTDKHETEPPGCMIWYRYVSKTIPLWYSLVISFLVCHLAHEPILSTDIIQWTIEGKLPYFAAFVEIEKQIVEPFLGPVR